MIAQGKLPQLPACDRSPTDRSRPPPISDRAEPGGDSPPKLLYSAEIRAVRFTVRFISIGYLALLFVQVAQPQPVAPADPETRQELIGPPKPAQLDFVGPPSPFLAPPPQLDLQYPTPNVALLDQDLEALLGKVNREYLIPSPETVLRSIFGFVVLLSLAYLAGHPRVVQVERTLGIAHVATTGIPFVLLGWFASQPRVAVLTPLALIEVTPLLTLGLGWIGFVVGYRFNRQLMENLPSGAAVLVGLTTALPFVMVSIGTGLLMYVWEGGAVDRDFLRDAAILGLAGALAARSSPYLWKNRGLQQSDLDRMSVMVQFERIVVVFGLMFVAAYFRPEATLVSWQLPGTAWLFITLGVGIAIGGVSFAILASSRNDSESLVLLLGSITFAAGMAHYLRLSAISVCFLVGLVMANAPGPWKGAPAGVVAGLERPIYFLFLVIGGALWRPNDWRGWALMGLFVTARLAGKRIAAWLLVRDGRYETAELEKNWLRYSPTGAISIAIVISAQTMYAGPRISWIVTAVIVGSVCNELLVQAIVRRKAVVAS